MCTGGDPGGGTSENLNPPRVRLAPARGVSGPASAKQREVGVSYKPSGGISPGAVRAITGSYSKSSPLSDVAVGNIAGRSDITKEQLGDLQTRATVGTRGLGKAGAVGGILNTIGTASAARLMDKLKSDTPTIGKLGDKPSYSVKPVTTKTGSIVGVTEPGTFGGRVYSGRPDMNPMASKKQEDDTPAPAPKPKVEEPVVDVEQMGSDRRATTKNRRGGGRRTSFGTRASLINLRNVGP